MKVSKAIPRFKTCSGDKSNFSNHRPYSILISFAKLIEKTVFSPQLMYYLNNHVLLYKHQTGFRRKHGTSQPLIHFTNQVSEALNEIFLNLSIFIDIKKAFDTVNFYILLFKLNNHGIKNIANNWFKI